MDELISKRAVIEAIEKARANVGHNLERSIGKSIIEILDDVGRDIDRLPPAEPQIIRCKECEHRDKYGCCKYWKGLAMVDIPIATDDNDFCSHAERRNDVSNER